MYLVASVLGRAVSAGATLADLVALGLFLPSLAVAVRRLHDTNRSSWFDLISLIPLVGAIILIVFMCQDCVRDPNRYGPELLAEEDVEHLAAAMDPGSTAGVLIWENMWAAPFASAKRGVRVAN